MTTKPTTLNEYIDELDRLVGKPNPWGTGSLHQAEAAVRFEVARAVRGDVLGVLRPIAREHKDEVNPIRQENARLRAELDKVSAERDDLARMVLEATDILRPQQEPEVRYFKTTNARHPIYYRAAGGVLEMRRDNGRWIGSAHDSLGELFACRKLISVSRDEAQA